VLRSAFFIVLLCALALPLAGFAQTPAADKEDRASIAAPISPQVVDAEAAIVKADWKTAASILTPWLVAHPDDAKALFDAAYVADAQNRVDDATALYRRSVQANPRSFEAHLSLGLLLARQGNIEDARPELAVATTLDAGTDGAPLKARAWRALAEIDRPAAGKLGDTTEASDDLLEALKLSPETPADTLLAASLAEQAGELGAAEKAYRRLLASDPKSAPANAGLAHLLIAHKQYPEAETLLRGALLQSPDDPPLTAQLATVLAAQNKAEALPLIQKLHDAHPTDAAITRMLAEMLVESGDAAASDRLYIALLAASPADPELLVDHGQNLIRLLKYPEAFAVFNKVTQLAPNNADAWSGLAFAASKTAQPSVTLHALTQRSKFLPEVASSYFLWAISYDALHQNAAAATYYHHFIEADAGKLPNQEWQAKQRLLILEK